MDYNDAKGDSPYRPGTRDGQRFAEDALVDLLRRYGFDSESRPAPWTHEGRS